MDFTPMVMLSYSKVGLQEIYTVAWSNSTSCLKSKSFLGYWTKKRRSESQSLRRIWCPIADLKMEDTMWPRVWAASSNWEQSPARTSVPQYARNSFPPTKRISLEINFSSKLTDINLAWFDMLMWGLYILSKDPRHITPEFWPAELWVNTFVLFMLQVHSHLLCSNTELI